MLDQFARAREARVSLDLGNSQTTVVLEDGRARLSAEATVSMDELRTVAASEDAVFQFRDGSLSKLIFYSDAFYEQVRRILMPGGTFLHYTGTPGRAGRRMDLPASVARRLARMGFVKIRNDSQMSCIVASVPPRRW